MYNVKEESFICANDFPCSFVYAKKYMNVSIDKVHKMRDDWKIHFEFTLKKKIISCAIRKLLMDVTDMKSSFILAIFVVFDAKQVKKYAEALANDFSYKCCTCSKKPIFFV